MIVAISDLHIGKTLRKGVTELDKDGAAALYEMLCTIQKKAGGEPVHLIVAGDAADTVSIDGAGINGLIKQLDEFVDGGNFVYYIQGNHDRQRCSDHAKPILSNVSGRTSNSPAVHLHNQCVMIEGKKVRGIDYMPPENLKQLLKGDIACDILVLHAAFEEILPFANSFDVSFEDIPSNVGTVIAGDIHTARKLQLVAGETRYFVSPGGLHSCAVDQKGPFGFWTLTGDDWLFTECPVRKIYESDIDETVTIDNVKLFIEAHDQFRDTQLKPVLSLKWDRSRSNLFEVVMTALQNDFIILDEAYTSSGKALDVKELQRTMTDFKSMTMDKALPFVCDAQKTPEAYKLLEQVLTVKEAVPVVESFITMAKAGTL